MIAKLIVSLLVFSCFANEQKPDQLYGHWKVIGVTGASPVTAMNGTAAARLIGRPLILTAPKVLFMREKCKPNYAVSKLSSAEFVQDYRVELKTLNLPDPVTRFDAGCMDIFVAASGKIIFTWKGYFLEAKKTFAK